jgi:hypothetical protein
MPTYCIDGSQPHIPSGQCCAQCGYETTPTACTFGGITYPQGTIMTTDTSSLQCWCQQGSIECRLPTTSVLSSWDLWGNGTGVYIIIIILVVLLLLGMFLCCGCTLLYYYYYRTNQEAAHQAYEQYWNSAGWQPMSEEGLAADASAEQKQAEAERVEHEYGYPTGFSESYIPPPYALYNGSYAADENGKDQKPV